MAEENSEKSASGASPKGSSMPWIVGIIVIIVLIAGGFYLYKQPDSVGTKEDKDSKIAKNGEIEKLKQEIEAAQKGGDEGVDFRVKLLITYAQGRERAKQNKEIIDGGYLKLYKERLNKLNSDTETLNKINFDGGTGDAAALNDYKVSLTSEVDYVQKLIDSTQRRLSSFDTFIERYDSGYKELLASNESISKEKWIGEASYYVEEAYPNMVAELDSGVQDFSDFVDNVKKQDSDYSSMNTKMNGDTGSYTIPPKPNSDYSVYDTILAQPIISNPITCTASTDELGATSVSCE